MKPSVCPGCGHSTGHCCCVPVAITVEGADAAHLGGYRDDPAPLAFVIARRCTCPNPDCDGRPGRNVPISPSGPPRYPCEVEGPPVPWGIAVLVVLALFVCLGSLVLLGIAVLGSVRGAW